MKLLYKHYRPENNTSIYVSRHTDGNYYMSLWHGTNPDRTHINDDHCGSIMIPPAVADELRIVFAPGFEPQRDDPNELAAEQEPPHPDD